MRPDPALANRLDPSTVWGRDAALARSAELSPLYVDRHVSPRTRRQYTAHDFWELTCVFRGRGEMHAGSALAMTPHAACLVPPGIQHYEYAEGELDTLWVGLQGTRLDTVDPTRVHRVVSRELTARFEQLWLVAQRRYRLVGPELDGLAGAAIGLFLRLLAEQDDPEAGGIDQAVEHLNRHFHEDISVTALALAHGISEGHFFRLFKRRVGMTPMKYLAGLRMRQALLLLRQSSLPITRIARMVGYPDALYFSKVCRKATGRSPTQLQRLHGRS